MFIVYALAYLSDIELCYVQIRINFVTRFYEKNHIDLIFNSWIVKFLAIIG